MGKALLWVVVILGGLMLARVLAHAKASSAAKSAARKPEPAPAPSDAHRGKPEAMVRCSHCGVHLPRSEATMIGGHTWCSSEHARLGNRNLG